MITERNSEGLIPWSAIRYYAEVEGYTEDFGSFLKLIRAMNEALLEFKRSKEKSSSSGPITPKGAKKGKR